jgi:hypothetical protein
VSRRNPNITVVSLAETASTRQTCALQRAENLASLGVKTVLELCVGPSLAGLEQAYSQFGIKVSGNDIDPCWQKYYPEGKWLMGDARMVDGSGFDAIVVAPPLSRGCTGKREDALSLEDVDPSYYDFLGLTNRVVTFVLPGRTLSVQRDRSQLFRFLSYLPGNVEVIPLRDKIVKYVDVYRTL